METEIKIQIPGYSVSLFSCRPGGEEEEDEDEDGAASTILPPSLPSHPQTDGANIMMHKTWSDLYLIERTVNPIQSHCSLYDTSSHLIGLLSPWHPHPSEPAPLP